MCIPTPSAECTYYKILKNLNLITIQFRQKKKSQIYFVFCRSFNIFSYFNAASVIFFFGLDTALLCFAFTAFFLPAVLIVFSGVVLIGLFPSTLFLSGALLVMTRCLSALSARDWLAFNVCKCLVFGFASSLAAKCGLLDKKN